MARTPPTLVANSKVSDWQGTGASKSTGSVSWQAGDLLVVVGGVGDESSQLGVPTATGLTFSEIAATANFIGNFCDAWIWTATAGSSGSGAIAGSKTSGPSGWGIAVLVIRGSEGTAAEAIGTSTTKTVSLVRSADESAVLYCGFDWSASSATATFTPGSSTSIHNAKEGASYSVHIGYWADQNTAGTTSYGVTSTSTGSYAKIAVEILGVEDASEGAASGAISWTGAATGARQSAGAVTGAVTRSGVATGARVSSGSATGTVLHAGGATGARASVGSAIGSLVLAGAATGLRASLGAVTGAIAWVGAATGTRSSSGAATGTVTHTGAATGARVSQGAVTGAVDYAGTATGESPGVGGADGSATGSITWTGTATGSRTSQGAASGTLNLAGAATGQRSSTGAALGSIVLEGIATGARAAYGLAQGAIELVGQAFGQAPGDVPTVTPPERTTTAEADPRTITVAADIRTAITPAENRTIHIPDEQRTA